MRKWTRRAAAALLALAAADFLYTAWIWLCWNRRPAMGQDVWLRYALAIKEGRGPLPFGNDLPLYPWLLSFWASRSPAAFTESKLFSLAVGVGTLAAVWRIGKKLYGAGPASLAAAALSVNWLFLSLSMSLRAEVVLPPLFLLAWYAARRGFEEPERAGPWWLASGALAGLAGLAKGTGPLFAAAWAGGWAAALIRRPRLWARGIWYAAGYLPLAGLLWWANRGLFGEGGRHFSIQHAVWLDSWWQLSNVRVEDLTFGNYLRAHGWLEIASRELRGIAAFLPVSLSCLSPSDSFPLAWLLRWPALAAAAASLWLRRDDVWRPLKRLDGGTWMTASLLGAFFMLFAWYHQVSPSERFVGPLVPIVFVLLGGAVWRAADRPFLRRAAERRGAAAAGAASLALAAGLAFKASQWGAPDPFALDRPAGAYARAIAWASARTGPVVYGPSDELPAWLLPPAVEPVALPERGQEGGFERWLAGTGATAAVVDADMARRPIARGFFRTQDGRVAVERLPAGWRTVGLDGPVALLARTDQ